MDNETIEDFARYRLNKAKETLETAKMIFNEGKDFSSANNRAKKRCRAWSLASFLQQ